MQICESDFSQVQGIFFLCAQRHTRKKFAEDAEALCTGKKAGRRRRRLHSKRTEAAKMRIR